jgi:hypothetical protein
LSLARRLPAVLPRLLVCLATSTGSAAADAPPAAAAPAIGQDTPKERAKLHFLRGLEFARKDQNYDAALAEFLASRELFPTQVALLNAAISLTRLGRYDDALSMYAELFELFGPGMTPEEKALANEEMADLQSRLGEVELSVNEPGAAVELDGRARGSTPLPAALRVAPGTHVVRVTKPGFEPFDARLVVASQQHRKLDVSLRPTRQEPTKPSQPPPPVEVARSTPPAPKAPAERSLHLAASVGAVISPSFNGGAAASCDASIEHAGSTLPGCRDRSRPLGPLLRVTLGYELSPGLELDLTLGYLRAEERLTRSVLGRGDLDRRYVATDYRDKTELSALSAALGIGYRFRARTPLGIKLGLGIARTSLAHENSGTFAISAANPKSPNDVYEGSESVQVPETEATTWLPLLAPEARIGFQITPHFSVDVGLGLLVMFGSSEQRTGSTSLSGEGERRTALNDVPGGFADGSDVRPGVIALPEERRLGTVVAFTPTLGGRFDL